MFEPAVCSCPLVPDQFFIRDLHKHDGDGNENVKKAMALDKQAMAVQAMDNALVSLIPIR